MNDLRIILVEDDHDLRDTVCQFLRRIGLNAHGAVCGAEMDALMAEHSDVGLVILDVNLPGESGFAIASRLRAAHSRMGVIMLTAFGAVGDRVLGLTLGADAYLSKPVQLEELQATILSLSRRLNTDRTMEFTAPPTATAVEPLSSPNCWVLDRGSWTLVVNGVAEGIPLTGAEYTILDMLFMSPSIPVSRDLIAKALGKNFLGSDDRSIDAVLTRLRRKVDAACGLSLPVKAVRGVGYVFAPRS